MTDATLARLKHDDLTDEDRKLAETLIANAGNDSIFAQLLQRILVLTDHGEDINFFTSEDEVTPNQAAQLLNMSRPHLLSFMDSGDLPFRRVGESRKHRKIKMSDLHEFMTAREIGQQITADALHGRDSIPNNSELLSDEAISELDNL